MRRCWMRVFWCLYRSVIFYYDWLRNPQCIARYGVRRF